MRYFRSSLMESPAPDSTLTIPNFRDDIFAIMDHLEINKAHLVGQSMGGFSALRCALDNPDRVSSLTLSCTPGGFSSNPSKLAGARFQGADGIKATMSKKTLKTLRWCNSIRQYKHSTRSFLFLRLSNLSRQEDRVETSELRT